MFNPAFNPVFNPVFNPTFNPVFNPGKPVLTPETNPFCVKTGFTKGSNNVLALKSFKSLFFGWGDKMGNLSWCGGNWH